MRICACRYHRRRTPIDVSQMTYINRNVKMKLSVNLDVSKNEQYTAWSIINMYIHIYIYIYICMYIYTCMFIYIYLNIRVCIYLYK